LKPIKSKYNCSNKKYTLTRTHKNTAERVRDERKIGTEQDKGGCTLREINGDVISSLFFSFV
jgi:hypothetical protein